MDILGKIFGSGLKVKIMRLYLFHREKVFDNKEIAKRTNTIPQKSIKDVLVLEHAGLLKKKIFLKPIEGKRGKRGKLKRRKAIGWFLNSKFEYLAAIHNLLINTIILNDEDITERLSKAGNIKLVIIAGIFIQDFDSRVDLLVVGDRIKKNILENIIKSMEADIGTELRYTYFETPDFQYRLGVYDKLIRDIIEFPHHKVIDKIDLQANKMRPM